MKNVLSDLKKCNLTFIFYAIISIGLALISTAFSFVGAKDVFNWWLAHPMIIVLNALPLFLMMVFIFGATKNKFFPIVFVAIFAILICYINKEKIVYREDPVFFADFVLWKEALHIIKQGSFSFGRAWIFLLLGIVFVFLSIKYGKNLNLNPKSRLSIIFFTIIFSMLSLKVLYAKNQAIERLVPPKSEVEINISQTVRDQGIFYSLLRYRDVDKVEKPHPFVPEEVKKFKSEFKPSKISSLKPDVIMIMGEAWSDLSENEHLKFKEGMDPFDPIRPLMQDAIATGHFVDPVFGGGTANTEYDAVTGNATLYLSSGRFTSYHAIRRDVESIARVLGRQGYNSYALHPGESWFYNREKAYAHMGFQNAEFKGDFADPEMKGKFISEDETYRHFTKKLDELRSRGEPYMALLVTIQNHSPFNLEKYGELPDSFSSDKNLTKESKEMLESYFVGIRDMNRNLKEFTDYLNTKERPTVLIYWGDHKPSLGSEFKAFKELGLNMGDGTWKSNITTYQTPYILWGNRAFRENFQKIETPKTVNANFASTLILRSFGAENIDPYFSFLSKFMDDMPVFHKYFYMKAKDGEFKPIKNEKEVQNIDEMFNVYRTYQYLRAK